MNRWCGLAGMILLVVSAAGQLKAQEGDYDWMPWSGPLILVSLKRQDLPQILAQKKTRQEWSAFFAGAGLNPKRLQTLAVYLAQNAPLPANKMPRAGQAVKATDLPPDGRELVLENCQVCHSVGPIVTATKPFDEWMQHLHGSTHGRVGFPEEVVLAISNYLTINAPMDVKEIPEVYNQPLPFY